MYILNTWAETWLVKFNPQKTEFVIFNNNKNIYQVNILFTGENIKQVEYHTHLGICLSSNCKWCYHINNTCQRATKRIHILRKLKYLLSRSHLSKIYKTYILPILEYACELWDDCCIRDTQKLECLQLEAARIVTGLPIYSSAESLYFETGWSKLEDRRKSRKLNLFYKIENNMAPTYLSDCLPTTIGETVTYNLRNNDDYRTQRCRLQTSSKSFFPSTIKLWNSLPDSVKSLPTFSKFKKAIQPVQIPVDSFYNIGDRKTNIIHTKLKHRCSGLKCGFI